MRILSRPKAGGGRRRLLAGMGVLTAMSLALTGCGSDSGGSGDPNTLTVAAWNLDETPEFRALFEAFEKANPEVTVKPVEILADDYQDKVSTMLAGGDATDVITVKNVTDYARWSSRGQLVDITDSVKSADTSNISGLEAYDSDGSYFALPYRQDFWLLYYNKKIFDDAGVDYPEDLTWDEYADVAEKLTEGKGDSKVYGTYHHTWRSVIQAISAAQTGGDQLSGEYDFFSDQYTMAKELQDSGDTLDFGTAKTQQADYRSMFESGSAAMLPMGTWYVSGILDQKEKGETDVEWGMAPMPQLPDAEKTTTFGSPTAFGVNKKAENSELAQKFVEFAGSAEGAKAIAEVGVVPALQTDDVVEQLFALDGMPEDEGSAEAFQPGEVALEMPVSEDTSDINTILDEEHELIMVGDKSIKKGIDSMNDRVRNEVLD